MRLSPMMARGYLVVGSQNHLTLDTIKGFESHNEHKGQIVSTAVCRPQSVEFQDYSEVKETERADLAKESGYSPIMAHSP